MIVETGHFALVMALLVSLLLGAVPLWGALLGRARWMALAPRMAGSLFGLVSISFAALLHAFALSDFSVRLVLMNSHTMMPMLYKLTAAFGNHEGSMLLWAWILSFWGFIVARRGKDFPPDFLARVLALTGMISTGFLLFILLTSNPFARLDPAPAQGMGFNPVLQDPALALHPPFLYMGYVGFSVAFCFALAALLEDKVDAAFAARVRPYALAAWVFLTAGILKGAAWAYYELGWGGFWFWDPVENAALMPWLSGTALLHAIAVLERRGAMRAWTVFLGILTFSLSLLGTFLVRSGVLTSVHAFASDPKRGIFILLLLLLMTGGAFLVFALRAPKGREGAAFSFFSRETAVLLNNLFLFTFCMTVLTGTLYPVVLSALDLGAVSVGPPYYAATLLPLLVPLSLLMGAVPVIAWGKGDKAALKKLLGPFVFALLCAVAPLAFALPLRPAGMLGLGAGGWIIAASLHDAWRKGLRMPLSYSGMIAAHAGLGLLIMGAAVTTQYMEEKILWMSPGDRVTVGRETLAFLGVETGLGPDYNVERGVFSRRDGTFMAPEKRWYPVAEKETSEVALRMDFPGLAYLVLGERDDKDARRRVVRAYYHPLIVFVPAGGILMCFGGALAAFDRRRRVVA